MLREKWGIESKVQEPRGCFLSAESVEATVVMISGASGVQECGHRECRIERENALTDNIGGKSSNTDNRVPSSSAFRCRQSSNAVISPFSQTHFLILQPKHCFLLFFFCLSQCESLCLPLYTCPRFLQQFSVLSCITVHQSCQKMAYVAVKCHVGLVGPVCKRPISGSCS